MNYISYTRILDDPAAYYLLVGYRNPAGQLDIAKFNFTLLSNYYIKKNTLDELSAEVDKLSAFVDSCLDKLSGDGSGLSSGKITVPELSAYCSYSRYNELKEERTFIACEEFMNYIRDNFKLSSTINNQTALNAVGSPLEVARTKIQNMIHEARTQKKEE